MKMWKKNVIVAAVLVLVCAGIYLNWSYSQNKDPEDLVDTLNAGKLLDDDALVMADGSDPLTQAALEDLDGAETSTTDYFAAVRSVLLSRQQSRDSAVSMLQEAMSYGEEADGASSQKLESIVETALSEAQIESLVIAKGYTDCVAYMTDSGISVAVAAPEGGLQAEDVSLISDVILTQTAYELADIRIIEVK